MNKKKGFTLVELLAVIVILAVVVSISGAAVFSVTNRARKNMSEEMRSNLTDAALSYAITNLKLKKCSTDFSNQVYLYNNIVEYSNNTECAKKITIKTLKDADFFSDKKDYCGEDDEVMIYRYYDGVNSEYKVYVSDDLCENY